MEKIPQMVDMAIKPIEIENVKPIDGGDDKSFYPYGLTLTLNDDSLSKLNMEDDCCVGDMVHFHCLAKVTSCSEHEGSGKCVNLQIVAMSAEDEDEENEESEQQGMNSKTMYGDRD